jgi:hypothetical protein
MSRNPHDRVEVPLAEALTAHSETFSRRQADYPELDVLKVTPEVETGPESTFARVNS